MSKLELENGYLEVMSLEQLVHDLVLAWGVDDTEKISVVIKELGRRYLK